MIVIDFVGFPGTGKSTIMKNIDDEDIVKWVDIPAVDKFDLLRHILGSWFFWRNLFLILRVSYICGFHGKRRIRSKRKNLEVILHFIYNAERYSDSYKVYLVEKGPVSVLPVRSGVRGYKVVERFLDRLVKRYPHAILYFYSDAPSIVRNMRRRKTEVDKGMLESPVLERRISRGKRVMQRNIEWIDEKLLHTKYIKVDDRDLEGNLKLVRSEIKKVREKAGV